MPTKLDRIISIDVLEGIASASELGSASDDDVDVDVDVDVEREGSLSRDRSAKVVRWWARCLGTGKEESQVPDSELSGDEEDDDEDEEEDKQQDEASWM